MVALVTACNQPKITHLENNGMDVLANEIRIIFRKETIFLFLVRYFVPRDLIKNIFSTSIVKIPQF